VGGEVSSIPDANTVFEGRNKHAEKRPIEETKKRYQRETQKRDRRENTEEITEQITEETKGPLRDTTSEGHNTL
jgi:hypothetical protein